MNTMKSPTTSTNVLRASALCALIAGALLSFPLLSANAQTIEDQIRLNRDIGKCWHKKDPWDNNGNIIHLWWCLKGDGPLRNQLFFYDPSTGFIRSSANQSKCIHKKNPGWRLGDVVHLWDCAAGEDENKVFDYNDNDGRVIFRFNPEFCAGLKFLGQDAGNPIVVKQCKFAESYTITGPKSDSTSAQGPVPCSGRAPETLVLEVKTGNLQGSGSSAQMLIRIVFDDWDTGDRILNSDLSFYADGNDVINTGIEIPGGCNRKGTNMKSMVIENRGSSGIFSADAWFLKSICARSSSERSCSNPLTINRWIYGGGRLTWGWK